MKEEPECITKCNKLEVALKYLAESFDNTSTMVIFGVTVICIAAIFKMNDPSQILSNALTGLFGVATGRAMK